MSRICKMPFYSRLVYPGCSCAFEIALPEGEPWDKGFHIEGIEFPKELVGNIFRITSIKIGPNEQLIQFGEEEVPRPIFISSTTMRIGLGLLPCLGRFVITVKNTSSICYEFVGQLTGWYV